MKRALFISTGFLLLTAYFSCKKDQAATSWKTTFDPCTGYVCVNGTKQIISDSIYNSGKTCFCQCQGAYRGPSCDSFDYRIKLGYLGQGGAATKWNCPNVLYTICDGNDDNTPFTILKCSVTIATGPANNELTLSSNFLNILEVDSIVFLNLDSDKGIGSITNLKQFFCAGSISNDGKTITMYSFGCVQGCDCTAVCDTFTLTKQ